MGYVPPSPPKAYGSYTDTLYTIARIMDIAAQYVGGSTSAPGLPRSYAEYIRQLGYAPLTRFGVLIAQAVLVAVVVGAVLFLLARV